MRTRHIFLSVSLAASWLMSQPAVAQLPPATYNSVVASLVGVESSGCPEGKRYLQGFVVQSSGFAVVTALHGVAGCSSPSVLVFAPPNFTTLARQVKVDVAKVLRRGDLALLRARDPNVLGPAALTIGASPLPNSSIYSVARWLGASGARDKLVRVANGSTMLQNIAAGVSWLSKSTSPASDIEIVNTDIGDLLPGTSGSPLVNDAGQVVAVADGGLDGGTAGINWAIPSRYIPDLLTSNDPLPTAADGSKMKTLFSRAVLANSSSLPAVNCGPYMLVKVHTETLGNIAAWVDDPLSLAQIVRATGVPTTTPFDVYQANSTGATVILPRGMKFASGGTGCTATTGSGIKFVLQMEQTSGLPMDVQNATVVYELQTFSGVGWVATSQYPFAQARRDGLVVMRKSAARGPQFGAPKFELGFETLASRGSELVEYAAVNSSPLTPSDYQFKLPICRHAMQNGTTLPGCVALVAEADNWSRAMIAVHLTTFTLGRASQPVGAQLPWTSGSTNIIQNQKQKVIVNGP